MKHMVITRTTTRQKGVAAVEFAIVLPLLILIFTGLIEYGRLMWHYDALAKATRDAARFLADEPLDSDKKIPASSISDARNMVEQAAIAAGVTGLVNDATGIPIVCSPTPTPCTSPNTITVSVSYAFTIGGWVPIIGPAGSSITSVSLSPHTTMRYMR